MSGYGGNANELYLKRDPDNQIWHEFIAAWYGKYGCSAVGTADLFSLASTPDDNPSRDDGTYRLPLGQNLLGEVLGGGNEQSRKIRLGRLLRERVGRVYGEFKVCDAGEAQRASQYQLQRLSSGESKSEYSESGELKSTLTRENSYSRAQHEIRAREYPFKEARVDLNSADSPHSLSSEPDTEVF